MKIGYLITVVVTSSMWLACVPARGDGARCCGCQKAVCRVTVDRETVQEDCFEVECENVCIPPVRFWWECGPLRQTGKVRAVRKLTTEKVSRRVCTYTWDAVTPCEKVSGTNHAQHPEGRSGYWFLTPFHQPGHPTQHSKVRSGDPFPTPPRGPLTICAECYRRVHRLRCEELDLQYDATAEAVGLSVPVPADDVADDAGVTIPPADHGPTMPRPGLITEDVDLRAPVHVATRPAAAAE